MALELTREVAGVLVTETRGSLFDIAAIPQEFDGPFHSQPLEPLTRPAAKGGQEEALQHADGDTAGPG